MPKGRGEPLAAGTPRRGWGALAEGPPPPRVAPLGAWVEGAPRDPQQPPAHASASRVEEELEEREREKAARLRCFQGAVRERVNRQVRMRRKQQLRDSCAAAERERCVALQCLRSALRLAPRKDTCLFRSHPAPAIRHPGVPGVPVERQGAQSEAFQQRAATLRKTVEQVRRRLASRRTLPRGTGPPELPGGVWGREKPEPCEAGAVPAEAGSEELLLAGHHDLPAELQDQGVAPRQAQHDEDFYIKIQLEKFWDGAAEDWSLPASPQRPHTDGRAPLMLWAGADQEETKKQRQNEYLRYRRLFMDVEREQVKEQRRRRERQRRIAEIKSKKETQRRAEERRMQKTAEQQEPFPGEGAWETLAQLQLEERRVEKVKDNQQRNKEYTRYLEALRAQVREKIKLHNIDLPPLCSCGSDFWDSHPDTCANNCVFYKNHKAYGQALRSLLSSCARPRLPELAALCARRGKKPPAPRCSAPSGMAPSSSSSSSSSGAGGRSGSQL